MKKVISLTLVAIMTFGLIGCAQPATGSVLQSDKPRNTSPATDKADLASLVDANSAFSFDMYRMLRSTDGNIFYSPYSISLALAMTYAGARGDTEKQMASALHFLLPQDRLHPAFNDLDLTLASRGQGAKGKDGKGFRLNIVNAIWGQKGFGFLSPFLDVLAENYGAGLRILDYMKDPEQARQTINNWVNEQTEEKIKDLVPQGAIDTLTRLVLTNAIYFNAAWKYPFNKYATTNGEFNLLNGNRVTVPLMQQTESFGYAKGNGYQAVELPYDGSELSMVVLVPEPGQFNSFESSLSSQKVGSIIQQIKSREVVLSMPKFKYESSFGLKKALTDLGMGVAFTTGADFSGMDGKKDLFIQDVLHKAFVSVDEAGTEAAAATAVIIGVTSVPAETIELKIDRPFIFLIRDIGTGTILFIGRVVNPSLS